MDGLHNWQASVNICARSNVTLDIALHVVGVRTVAVRTLSHNQTFLPMVRALSMQELRWYLIPGLIGVKAREDYVAKFNSMSVNNALQGQVIRLAQD